MRYKIFIQNPLEKIQHMTEIFINSNSSLFSNYNLGTNLKAQENLISYQIKIFLDKF